MSIPGGDRVQSVQRELRGGFVRTGNCVVPRNPPLSTISLALRSYVGLSPPREGRYILLLRWRRPPLKRLPEAEQRRGRGGFVGTGNLRGDGNPPLTAISLALRSYGGLSPPLDGRNKPLLRRRRQSTKRLATAQRWVPLRPKKATSHYFTIFK